MPYKNGTSKCFVIKVSTNTAVEMCRNISKRGLKLEGKAWMKKKDKLTDSKYTSHDIKIWCHVNGMTKISFNTFNIMFMPDYVLT